jgi:RNA-binding protein 39
VEAAIIKETNEAKQRDRDMRTVFVQQIHPKVDDIALLEYFSACGEVSDVKIITDPRSGRSKGLAYVEFAAIDSVPIALALTGQNLAGYPIVVHTTVTDRRPVAKPTPSVVPLAAEGRFRIVVSNLEESLVDGDLRPVFEAFGELVSIEIPRNGSVGPKGELGVVYKRRADALSAMQGLNGFELVDRPMQVVADFAIDNSLSQLLPSVTAALTGGQAPAAPQPVAAPQAHPSPCC